MIGDVLYLWYADVDSNRAGLAGLWKWLWGLCFGHVNLLRANGRERSKLVE